ncbi:hypothetical protein [Tropicimonas sp.]|uniref:hypothetical protein n=1 Tax=Tropicimonas sp. TaxID=2067044 RepID=UPI003A874D8F
MSKLIAILNVVAWAGFWAFGCLALTSGGSGRTTIALLLAALGAGAGLWAYMWLVRHSERTGYARLPRRAVPEQDRAPGKYAETGVES